MSEVSISNNEVNKKKSTKDTIIDRLKKLKKSEWIVIGVMIAVALLIYYNSTKMFNNTSDNDIQISNSISTTSQYISDLESRLSNVLSKIYGAGNVSVMISIASGSEIVVATSSETKTNTSTGTSNSSQSNTIVEKPIIIGDEPLVLFEKLPQIKGVIIVAQGANNVQVRLEMLKAVQALLDVDADNIEIFVGN